MILIRQFISVVRVNFPIFILLNLITKLLSLNLLQMELTRVNYYLLRIHFMRGLLILIFYMIIN